jgi:hypothetical protein
MLRILFILLLATSSISLRCQAQTYKCKVAGSTIYSPDCVKTRAK